MRITAGGLIILALLTGGGWMLYAHRSADTAPRTNTSATQTPRQTDNEKIVADLQKQR